MFDRKEAIKKKIIAQDKAVLMLGKTRRILLSWATGVGKTLASLKMVEKYYAYNKGLCHM